MVQFHLHQPKFRARFNKLISSSRSHTLGNQSIHSPQKSLAQLSSKTLSQQKNKKIHNMSKQTYITSKKQLLLSRKLFYKSKPQDTQLLQIENIKKFNKINVYEDLMDQTIQQEDIFNIQKQILNNPINFHRNMMVRVKDDEQTKGILRQWYKTNVSPNRQKLRSVSQINQSYSPNNFKSCSIENHKINSKVSSIFSKKRMNIFTNQRLRNCKSNVNQVVLKKNLSFEEDRELKQKNTEKLAKLIVRVQPFWDKVRIKI